MIKKVLNKIQTIYKRLKRQFSCTHYISLGENCLTDNILQRFNIKSFTTPYSHARSNLDYAIHLEKERYSNLLRQDFLYYDYVGDLKVVRNSHYSKSDIIYSDLHLNGFEFTHHDLIDNQSHMESYSRKIIRMCSLNSKDKLKFLYHYRNNENMNIQLLINKAKDFLSCYQSRKIKAEFIFFTQEIINNKNERAMIKIYNSKNIKGYVFRTMEIWQGDDQNVFWARNDNDLIKKMINDIK